MNRDDFHRHASPRQLPIAKVIAEGKVRTYDMGGNNSTLEVGKAVTDHATA